MSALKYTEEHEWLQLDDDGLVIVGITDYAQEQLGDVVYVELPEVGGMVSSGDEVAVIESVKAAGDIKAPLTGEVMAVNEKLADEPETVNSDPQGDGWFFKLKIEDESALEEYMDEEAYQDFIMDL